MYRVTIELDDTRVALLDVWRAKQRGVPSRRAAVNGILDSVLSRLDMPEDPKRLAEALDPPKPPSSATPAAVGRRLTEEETQRGHLRVAPVGSLLKTKGTKR